MASRKGHWTEIEDIVTFSLSHHYGTAGPLWRVQAQHR